MRASAEGWEGYTAVFTRELVKQDQLTVWLQSSDRVSIPRVGMSCPINMSARYRYAKMRNSISKFFRHLSTKNLRSQSTSRQVVVLQQLSMRQMMLGHKERYLCPVDIDHEISMSQS